MALSIRLIPEVLVIGQSFSFLLIFIFSFDKSHLCDLPCLLLDGLKM